MRDLNNSSTYVVAAIHEWNHREFKSLVTDYKNANWHLVRTREELTFEILDQLNPEIIFFPHWSWKVPSEILDQYECICFHMTDLPFGRGGSPLQNLISRGINDTVLTALRMTEDYDAGPVCLKRPLNLSGSAQSIYERCAKLTFQMIQELVDNKPEPKQQIGKVSYFERRKPEQSVLPMNIDLTRLYDHIRMLDADDYPKAFVDIADYHLEFSGAEHQDEKILAQVVITKRNKGN